MKCKECLHCIKEKKRFSCILFLRKVNRFSKSCQYFTNLKEFYKANLNWVEYNKRYYTKISYSQDLELFTDSIPSVCIELRFNQQLKKWVALIKDPCIKGICENKFCINFQSKFILPERLLLIHEDLSLKKRQSIICSACYNYNNLIDECEAYNSSFKQDPLACQEFELRFILNNELANNDKNKLTILKNRGIYNG